MAHLFIIAGHGAGDCGAVGYGYTEAERVRALASRLSTLGGGNVTVADTNRNWYADNGIMSLNIPKDWQILELHMDSAGASAKGGHVIINSAYSADQYDTALANFRDVQKISFQEVTSPTRTGLPQEDIAIDF